MSNTIAAILIANLRRLVADRSNLFFLIVFPLGLVFAIGSALGSSASSNVLVGAVDQRPTAMSRSVMRAMEQTTDVQVKRYDDADAMRHRIVRGDLDAGWVASTRGRQTTISWYTGAIGGAQGMEGVMARAVQQTSERIQVTELIARRADVSATRAAGAGRQAATVVPSVRVTTTTIGKTSDTPQGMRAVIAGGELSLFIFMSSLFGAQALLATRQYGISRRIRAAPAPPRAVIIGEALARYMTAAVQALVIVLGSTLLMGVDWQSLPAVLLLSAAMALVGTGGAMLLGAFGKSEQQVGSISLALGLPLAALGGSMVPIEFFPPVMKVIAHLTPHGWMNEALWRVLTEGAGVVTVLPAVLVLTAAGAILTLLAGRALARAD